MYQVIVFDKNKSPLEITRYTIEKARELEGDETAAEEDMKLLTKRLEKILSNMEQDKREEKRYIILPCKGSEIVIEEKEIVYIERNKRITKIHLKNNVLEIGIKLSELEEYLGSTSIVRCHNSFAVNMENVAVFSRSEFAMQDNSRVPISRARYKAVREAFLDWAKKQNLEIR